MCANTDIRTLRVAEQDLRVATMGPTDVWRCHGLRSSAFFKGRSDPRVRTPSRGQCHRDLPCLVGAGRHARHRALGKPQLLRLQLEQRRAAEPGGSEQENRAATTPSERCVVSRITMASPSDVAQASTPI
jgi:hypothetical protein